MAWQPGCDRLDAELIREVPGSVLAGDRAHDVDIRAGLDVCEATRTGRVRVLRDVAGALQRVSRRDPRLRRCRESAFSFRASSGASGARAASRVELELTTVYEVRDGSVTRLSRVRHSDEALEAAGLSE